VLISDHINLLPEHPLRGDNDERLGPRFPDMTDAYRPSCAPLARVVARHQGLAAHEASTAPCRDRRTRRPPSAHARTLGADLVGMSTVPEVIALRHMGARVARHLVCHQPGRGISDKPLSHEEVTETATRVRARFIALLDGILEAIGREKV